MSTLRPDQLEVSRLGEPRHDSPFRDARRLVDESTRILAATTVGELEAAAARGDGVAAFEAAGARARNYFRGGAGTKCGIVTCGGLCPGLNDVIRAIVLCAWHHYGVREIFGYRYGYAGLAANPLEPPRMLDPECVDRIHEHGGTMLGSSRGPQDLDEMVDSLIRDGVDVLFAIGGDGTLRGASALARRLLERGRATAVVGVPKTIDNDIHYVLRSFGFSTAVEEATRSIAAAHAEAVGAFNGVGLVKLMGRQSGFIAANATLANSDVNFCLVPEFPVALDGPNGFLEALESRLKLRRHAVLVVAEGFGQDLVQDVDAAGTDASGNLKLADVGGFLKDRIQQHFASKGLPLTIKYIDPSYTIRACPAGALDSELCIRFGYNAVHAGMAGRTDLMIGLAGNGMTHVPIAAATSSRRQLRDSDQVWHRVLETTGQAALFDSTSPSTEGTA